MAVEIDINNLSEWLSAQADNTAENPYEIIITNLTSANLDLARNALLLNPTKFVDLSETTLPVMSTLNSTFYGCTTLIKPPIIPYGVSNLFSTFQGCTSLVETPVFPDSITGFHQSFRNCSSLKTIKNFPSIYQFSLNQDFYECSSLETVPSLNKCSSLNAAFGYCTSLKKIPTLPDTIVSMQGAFIYCSSLETVPNIPQNIRLTSLDSTFKYCTSLLKTPYIPETIKYMPDCFYRCTNLKEVTNIPSSITDATDAFFGCTSLEIVKNFEVPLSVWKNNDKFYMFSGCPNLSRIEISEPDNVDWHFYKLTFNSDSIEGYIYDKDSNKIALNNIENNKVFRLYGYTDELWFPENMTEQEIESVIQNVLNTKYSYYNKNVVPADENAFILEASNPNNFKTNLIFPADLENASGTLPVSKGGTGTTTSKGSATKPVFLSSSSLSECSTYAGGTKVTLNGSGKGGSTADFYAPTSAGTSGQVLKSNGSGAPSWQTISTISESQVKTLINSLFTESGDALYITTLS